MATHQKSDYYHLYKKFDNIFLALANRTRRYILFSLLKKPLTVNEICEGYGFARPTISKHLKVLENANLIISSTDGKYHYFYLKPETLREAFDYFSFITKT